WGGEEIRALVFVIEGGAAGGNRGRSRDGGGGPITPSPLGPATPTAPPPLSSSRAALARANTNSCSGVEIRQSAPWVLVQKRSRVGSSASSSWIGMMR